MTVRDFLAYHTSEEIAELRAFDRINPIGFRYEREALANIEERLQMVCLSIAASAGGKEEDLTERGTDGVKRPKIAHYPRPDEMYYGAFDEGE